VNLILLHPDDFVAEERVELSGRRFDHVRKVHRAAVGDFLRVGLLDGKMGRARVARLGARALELDALVLDTPPPPAADATLILALPRPLILKRVLHAATALGVKRIVLVQTKRVEKTFWDARALQDDALHAQLILGLEQARDTMLPELIRRRRFRPFVEDELPGWVAGARSAHFAHPGQAAPCPGVLPTPSVLMIGPEGGLLDFEVSKLEEAGLSGLSLGERILRVDAAVPFLLSRLAS